MRKMRTAGPSNIHNRHKVAFSEQVREAIRISDIVLELLDSRYIKDSRIPEMEEYVQELGKKLIYVVTKTDLVSLNDLRKNFELKELKNPLLVSSLTKQGLQKLRERLIIESKRLDDPRITHVTLVGYPNTGKSTLINLLVRRNAAPVSSQAGWTKGIRKIRFNKNISIIDAPGIINKGENLFQGSENLKKHIKLGVQNPESVRDPEFVVADLMSENPGIFEQHYSIDAKGDSEILLEELAKRKNFFKKKSLFDLDRTARAVLKDWQKGLIKKTKHIK